IAGLLFILLRDRPCNRGVQAGYRGNIAESLVIEIPDAPRLRLQRRHGGGGIRVVSYRRQQGIQFGVGADEEIGIVGVSCSLEALRQLQEVAAIDRFGEPRRAHYQYAFYLAPQLYQLEMSGE